MQIDDIMPSASKVDMRLTMTIIPIISRFIIICIIPENCEPENIVYATILSTLGKNNK